jgi:RimJ/RimL family protein N-acetyltransferase
MLEDSVIDSREVQLLSMAHAEGIRALSMQPDVAPAAGLSAGLSPEEAGEYIAAATRAREEGKSYIFVLTDRTEVLGVCRLIGVRGVPRLVVAVGQAHRGRGNGSFLVRHVLEFAFETLQLERITATGACLVIVSQFGRVDNIELTRQAWQAAQLKA